MSSFQGYKNYKNMYRNLINQQDIKGFTLIENFITPEYESELIKKLNNQKWVIDYQRRLQYYNYRNELVKPYSLIPIPALIPEFLNILIDKMINDRIITDRPDQIIINEYKPGEGLKPHTDRKLYFKELIIGLSLNSGATMVFSKQSTHEVKKIYIPPRSLYIMKDEARYKYKHGIIGRKNDEVQGIKIPRDTRISITFRYVIKDKVKTTNIIYPESKV